jgi:hypothetical protein
VSAALRTIRVQGIAMRVRWSGTPKEKKGAVIFVDVIDGERFREVAEITPADIPR